MRPLAGSASRLPSNSIHLQRRARQVVSASSRSTAPVRPKLSLAETISTWTSGSLFSAPTQLSPSGKRQLTFSTAVHCHNRLGRLYIFVIAPLHRLIVRSSLRSAARLGWPLATEA
ncbi:DUF2867 domain-containing protein [Pseudomonas sp. LJDD11]|uniref:DUF2867 domain-containing protein n=1 Tax=Pseudomonas sp. LJDD11 TaxID=2931984 RepID=UPI00211C329E|nr:DUF2867 domain-containing protein [Pseudomonas sp. LJDD11]MCQ9426839.1 DUF2867 domain-containing protein [Pseudomonas sp. LJDD11]